MSATDDPTTTDGRPAAEASHHFVAFVPVRSPAERRRLGAGLLGFGLVGILFLVPAALLMIGSFRVVGLGGGLDDQQRALVRALEATSAALSTAETGTGDLGTSVTAAAGSARDASALADGLAAAMRGLSDASDVSILGNQPFAGVGAGFANLADRSDAMASRLDNLGASLERSAANSEAVEQDLGALRGRIDELRATVDEGTAIDRAFQAFAAARVLLIGVLAWLLVPAVAAVWLGFRLLREDRERAVRAAPGPP